MLMLEKGVLGVLRLGGRLGKRREFISMSMRVTYTGLAFLTTVLLTHLVSPGELGQYFAILALILLIGSAVQSGWAPFLVREIIRWTGGDAKKWILGAPIRIILNLRYKRWNQIKSLMYLRKLIQQFHHPVVIFKRMQAHPGQAVFAGD